MPRLTFVALLGVALASLAPAAEEPSVRLPQSARNLLLDAKLSSNLESYDKGRRGAIDHMLYDPQRRDFVKPSQHHEYGVGFGEDLGALAETRPAWWMAEWPRDVQANLIALSGAYPNQPQPDTAWKIELRDAGQWRTYARGVGGWYDHGRYLWDGRAAAPLRFNALRVSLFSKDGQAPVKSVHFRGEEGRSWIVAHCLPLDAQIKPSRQLRAGAAASFEGAALLGKIKSWEWKFGDGAGAKGQQVSHTYAKPGDYEVALAFSDGEHRAEVRRKVTVRAPVVARIAPLEGAVLAGRPQAFSGAGSRGKIAKYAWDFGAGKTASGKDVNWTFDKPGIYQVKLTVSDGQYDDTCLALVRAHTRETLRVPQVVLDTDQKNEQDDQHYLGYGVFSELDILGVNSVHHGGGQEPVNYEEIQYVLKLSRESGLPPARVPLVFRGANQRLAVPPSGRWQDTELIDTAASRAILAAARGAAPTNPVWVVPVGPGTNVACAILQARDEGLELKGRLRVMWLGGSNAAITGEFNGNNDPWSMAVVGQSGLETWIVPAPVGARVRIDKRTEAALYADNPLGRYLLKIVPASNKPLFDPACLSAIISRRLELGWVKETEYLTVGGPNENYRWEPSATPTSVRVIRQIDQEAMKADIFDTMKGNPRPLRRPE